MGNQILPCLFERYSGKSEIIENSPRFRAMAEMCSRYNLTPRVVDRPVPGVPLLLQGSSREWVENVCSLYKENHLILEGCPALYRDFSASFVGENTNDAARQTLQYLKAAGKTRIALLGTNRLSYGSKYYAKTLLAEAAKEGLPMNEDDVFWDSGESLENSGTVALEESYRNFKKEYEKYDAVICYNTHGAVFFCTRAKADGIRIPEDLYVIGRGELQLAKLVRPSITTISIDETEMGRQIVKLFRYLCNNPYVNSVSAFINSYIAPRETTEFFTLPQKKTDPLDPSLPEKERVPAKTYVEIGRLDNMLANCSDMDLRILSGIRQGVSREVLAEREITTASTVGYRLKRMMKHVGANSKEELFALLDLYNVDVQNYLKLHGASTAKSN